jgi:hypothetical protein
MKITKSQLKTIILEEAAKVKKEMQLREQLEKVEKELEEVMGGPHSGGKKTYKSAKGDFVPNEFPGALVEKDKHEEEEEMEETYSFEEGELEEMLKGMEEVSQEEEMEEGALEEEEEEFSEEELEEMFKQMEEEMGEGAEHHEEEMEEGAKHHEEEMGEGAKHHEEEMEEGKKYNLSESAEVLRMKKLAGLI